MVLALLTSLALAGNLEHTLTYDVAANGTPVGKRNLLIKYIKEEGDVGMRRVLEATTELDGAVGPMQLRYRQRCTGHAKEREPASFHCVTEQNGGPVEVQGRWTPAAWWITTTSIGRSRTLDMPLNRVDLSVLDLMDPDTRFPLSHFETLKLLLPDTGEVTSGKLVALGVDTMKIKGMEIQVSGYAWETPQGRWTFQYSADGFLVDYTMNVLGIDFHARLDAPPPGGIDDFPVAAGRAAVEVIEL